MSPKIKLAALKDKLGGFGRLARMNPNSPGMIGRGYNPIAFADHLPKEVALDLVPVRPMADHGAGIARMLQQQLSGICAKPTS